MPVYCRCQDTRGLWVWVVSISPLAIDLLTIGALITLDSLLATDISARSGYVRVRRASPCDC